MQINFSIAANGFSGGNFIVIVDDLMYGKNLLYITLKHELGHSFGLLHIKKEYPALMNLGGNNGNITKWDIMQFEFLYGPIDDL